VQDVSAHWEESKRERLQSRLAELKAERQSWETVWRDLSEQLAPYLLQLDPKHQRNRGEKKDAKILNSRPVRACKTLEAGMMAGITSPARDWFGLVTGHQELDDAQLVRVWLDECRDIIAAELAASNFYRALAASVYPGMVRLGTGAMFLEEIAGSLRFRPMPLGEYWLDVNADGVIDTCFRELAMTARQMAQQFGLKNCSQNVREAIKNKKPSTVFTVCHAVYPNNEYEPGRLGRHGMRFASCWWDPRDERKDKLLLEGGYEEFPVLAPRWSAMPSDAYGRGPGWDARGDCRMLQHLEHRLMQLVDKITNPPMKASGSVTRGSLLPGDITHVGANGQMGTFEPAIEIQPQAVTALEGHIERTEIRISETFYEHLWNLLIQDERNQRPTATEVEAKRQEVMLQLGPLLESLNTELLEPVIERTFSILMRLGRFPEPPEELDGQEVKIEFISIMHQMQQATGLVSIRTLITEIMAIAQVSPDVIDKVDADVIADDLAKITGVNPRAIRSDKAVAKVRKVRAEQEMQKQATEQALAVTQGISNVSGADPNQLTQLAQTLSPVAAAQGGALMGIGAG
jgi:hypothetical protein